MSFYNLHKSDRRVILLLLAVIVVALAVIVIVKGREPDTSVALTPDTTRRDTVRRYPRQPRERVRYVYRYREPRRRVRRHADSVKPTYRDTVRYYPEKLKAGEHVVLNTADTTELRQVPGIGPYFAKEIVRYGRRLGGYVSVDQLDEIDDFPQSAKQYFVVEQPQPRRLNVNRLSLQELRRHPYINYYQAKAIVDYRRLYGPITSLTQLGLHRDFPPEAISRIEPYVEY